MQYIHQDWVLQLSTRRSVGAGGALGTGAALGFAGLAAAAQLNKAGHTVTVYERADRIGGLLTYGIPNMKLAKNEVVERRIQLLRDEGVEFKVNCLVADGTEGSVSVTAIKANNAAVLLTTGATVPRDLPIPGRELKEVEERQK